MKFYLITSSGDNSDSLPQKYKDVAQSEECVYERHTPISYINNPPPGWYKDSPEKLETALYTEEYKYDGVPWIRFSYPGKRYFIHDYAIELSDLIQLSGGQVNLYGRGMANSTRFFEEEECSVFFGGPEIGDNMILEFVDDGIENELFDFYQKNNNNI